MRECGDILGVTTNLPQDSRDAKHILEYVFTQVVEFKKLNQVCKEILNHRSYGIDDHTKEMIIEDTNVRSVFLSYNLMCNTVDMH